MSVTVIIGPSGAGKSTVAEILQNNYGFTLEKTVTTREKRNKYDVDHTFVTTSQFKSLLDNDQFYGTLSFMGHQYGLPKFEPSAHSLLLLRAPAIEEFVSKFTDAYVVEIDAPLSVLEERLSIRDEAIRNEPEHLKKEIAWGRLLANVSIDSSTHTADEIAETIARAVLKTV